MGNMQLNLFLVFVVLLTPYAAFAEGNGEELFAGQDLFISGNNMTVCRTEGGGGSEHILIFEGSFRCLSGRTGFRVSGRLSGYGL